uniref:CBFD_NFYB_HMF domain-containing protein n=1 Tax=Heterorhabditis bacteriophora TaxID=37862 RepID=A0A1I7X179_HETBA
MISSDAPLFLAAAAEMFIQEITLRAWQLVEEGRRKTLQKIYYYYYYYYWVLSDIAAAASRHEHFDFLIDIVPREESRKYQEENPTTTIVGGTESGTSQVQYFLTGDGSSGNDVFQLDNGQVLHATPIGQPFPIVSLSTYLFLYLLHVMYVFLFLNTPSKIFMMQMLEDVERRRSQRERLKRRSSLVLKAESSILPRAVKAELPRDIYPLSLLFQMKNWKRFPKFLTRIAFFNVHFFLLYDLDYHCVTLFFILREYLVIVSEFFLFLSTVCFSSLKPIHQFQTLFSRITN